MNYKKIIETWGGLKPSIEAGPSGPIFRPFWWVMFPLMVLAVLTAWVRLTHVDFGMQEAIFQAGGQSWEIGQRSLWWFLYRFGVVPASLVFLLAVTGFILSMYREKFRSWNRVFLFIIFLVAIGPGLISNLLLKEYWGRPRPREVLSLGGTNAFEPVLTMDLESSGKSFPCGHATMGYFFMGGFFLLRRYHQNWARFFLIFGFGLGSFMGLARMAQGGHFFSDVIWAGAIMYFVALLLYYDLGLHRGLISSEARRMPKWAKIGSLLLGASTLAGILLGTPYQNIRNFSLVAANGDTRGPGKIELIVKTGVIEVVPAERFHIYGEAWGHGVPTSKVSANYYEFDRNGQLAVLYREKVSGAFTEVSQNLKVAIPWEKTHHLQIEADDCHFLITMPENLQESKHLVIHAGNGTVTLRAPGFGWQDEPSRHRFGKAGQPVGTGNPLVEVHPNFQGHLVFE